MHVYSTYMYVYEDWKFVELVFEYLLLHVYHDKLSLKKFQFIFTYN